MRRWSVFFFFLTMWVTAGGQGTPIGQWTEHLSYHHVAFLRATGNGFFVATPSAVFSVTGPDNELTRYTTINGLHSIGVSTIGTDSASGILVIGYNNSDLDIVNGTSITEVPDLEISSLTGDKTIHDIYITGAYAYVSTGLGIVALSLDSEQVSGTYIVGAGGIQTPVYSMTSDSMYWYAATGAGLRKALLSGSNLEDFNSWQIPTGDPAMDILPCSQVVSGLGSLFVLRNDSVWVSQGGSWRPFYVDGFHISDLQVYQGNVVLSETGRVVWLNTGGSLVNTLTGLVDPRGILLSNGLLWIADMQRGLEEWNGNTLVPLVPNSPDGPLAGQMEAVPGALWVTGGGGPGDTSGCSRYAGGLWTSYNSLTQPALSGLQDLVSVAVGRDTVYAGSGVGGFMVLPATAAPSVLPGGPVTGLTYDSSGNLWMVYSGTTQPLVEKSRGGGIQSFPLGVSIPGNQLGRILSDDFGYLWIQAAPGYGAVCFNPASGMWKSFMPGTGLGNLPDPNVNCMVMDKQGLVWIGTNSGIAVVECGGTQFTSACDATLPVVQNDAFAGYLFQGQQVLSMAVDGADRKWVGTASGAWLISEDGEQVIAQYNTGNSPLFNDTVNQIAIDGASGEVFFSTPSGMCSFKGTATEASQATGGVLVFPNPVPPGYSGTIGIKNLPEGSVVKITGLDGRLVYQTIALGGQAVWNGEDYTARRVASGVYLVLIAGSGGSPKLAAKIVFIH
jgi:hypothetical protein